MFGWIREEDTKDAIRVAQEIAQGRYDIRLHDIPKNSIGRLGALLNEIAENLQSQKQASSQDKAHLLTVLANMTEGVVAVDRGGRILVINKTLCSIFDIDADDAKGKPFLEILRQSELNALLQQVLQKSQSCMGEAKVFSPDERIFQVMGVPLMEQDQFVGALLVMHDISNLRRMEQMRREFVANVSHELRTPLAAIKGFAETLNNGALEDPKVCKEFLQAIEKNVDNMSVLVKDLLDLSSIESGQRPPRKTDLNVVGLIHEVGASLGHAIGKRKIAFTVKGESADIKADKEQLRQVFMNLLENAIKFNQDGGSIEVKVTTEPRHLKIQIKDSGSGIPAEELPRIFERFYRVDKARSREVSGTGLGLSIVKHILEAHGGSVSVESIFGSGSTFSIFLPL